ncbi:hypothetical protein AB6A40_011467 [Gnathostoma spinigerum]|uniref:Uncharacterized protein n=1 Tax=Gnathostoma spinigerum TaxID=75299 RepID=A0ABD6EXQ6_9BILA
MQQEVQRSGCLDASMIKQLSQEIGISQQSSSSSMDMLQQLARLLVPDSSCHGTEDTSSCVDLERFGIKTREQSPPVTGYFCGGATDPVPLRKEENNGLHLASFPGLRGPCDASRVPSSSQNPPTTWSPPTAIKTIFDQNTVKDNCNERQPQQVLAKELDIYAVRTRQGSNLGNTEIDFDDQCAGVRREATVSGLRPPTFGSPGLSASQCLNPSIEHFNRLAAFPSDYAVSASSSTSLLDNPDASSKQEDSRKREQKLKMMLNYRRQLTMKPGLSQWTGANNRANFTSSPTKVIFKLNIFTRLGVFSTSFLYSVLIRQSAYEAV